MLYVDNPEVEVGLFHWATQLSKDEQVSISRWYRGLSRTAQNYIDTLRLEAVTEADADRLEREWS